jgi:uncharacterized repeat protein (TIGR03803 family)
MIETIRRRKPHSIAVFLALAIAGCANGARQTSVVPSVPTEPAAQDAAHPSAAAGSSYRVLLRFNGSDGASPNGGLLLVNGQIIGTTRAGGTYHCRCGTVFKLTPKRRGYTERILHEFAAGKDGANPLYGPIASAGGSLLGATTSGGGNNSCGNSYSYAGSAKPCGTVFELKPDGSRYSERVLSTMGAGWSPQGLLDVKGTLYTVTEYGANYNGVCGIFEFNQGTGCGAVISLTPGRNRYVQHLLFAFPTAQRSWYPIGRLLADAAGTLYGVTSVGGPSIPSNCNAYGETSLVGCGSVFSLKKNGTLTTLHSFAGGSDGGVPAGGLTAGPNGVFYGAAIQGGGGGSCGYTSSSINIGCGVVYELTPSSAGYVESIVYAFKGGNDGAAPSGALIMDASHALYGTTAQGGGNGCRGSGCGTVFKLTPNGAGFAETILYAFKGGSDGATPTGSLTMGKNGRLFGATSAGGIMKFCTRGCGTVFAL